jgi:medium-chain acyl-[acyl-carrier-protein] hydrolase
MGPVVPASRPQNARRTALLEISDQMGLVPGIWKEQRVIESFDVDALGRLHPQTLFTYLLNAAWHHAKEMNYGYEELSPRNLMWVLIKMQILIKRLPKWGEQVTIETWGKRTERLYALRDFTIASGAGEKLISATSSWMILDRTSGRPQRIERKSESIPWQPGRDEIETNLEKVQLLRNGEELARFRVLFSDIDVNRHVNSAKYLQWMIDSHSYEHLEATEVGSIEISFLSEALPQDEVTVLSEGTEDQELCSVRRTGDGKELCRARFHWRPSRRQNG